MNVARMLLGAVAGAVGGAGLLLSQPAQAGLIGNGTNTVTAMFYLGTSVPAPPYTAPAPTEIPNYPTGPTTS
jgi:hypothetical protein